MIAQLVLVIRFAYLLSLFGLCRGDDDRGYVIYPSNDKKTALSFIAFLQFFALLVRTLSVEEIDPRSRKLVKNFRLSCIIEYSKQENLKKMFQSVFILI